MVKDRDLHGAAQSLFRYNRGNGPIKFGELMKKKEPTPEEAQAMIDKLFDSYSHLKDWMKNNKPELPNKT